MLGGEDFNGSTAFRPRYGGCSRHLARFIVKEKTEHKDMNICSLMMRRTKNFEDRVDAESWQTDRVFLKIFLPNFTNVYLVLVHTPTVLS